MSKEEWGRELHDRSFVNYIDASAFSKAVGVAGFIRVEGVVLPTNDKRVPESTVLEIQLVF